MQLRRCFGTMHLNHVNPDIYGDYSKYADDNYETYWRSVLEQLKQRLAKAKGYHSGAFALELGDVTQRIHIQFYVEHTPKRFQTLARDFGVLHEEVFQTVIDAKGAWEYCTGLGKHVEKFAFARFTFGTPKLAGSREKIALTDLVNLYISGVELHKIMKLHPYAYCVHRDRLRKFADDWTLWENRN